jgi:hypothetical protein
MSSPARGVHKGQAAQRGLNDGLPPGVVITNVFWPRPRRKWSYFVADDKGFAMQTHAREKIMGHTKLGRRIWGVMLYRNYFVYWNEVVSYKLTGSGGRLYLSAPAGSNHGHSRIIGSASNSTLLFVTRTNHIPIETNNSPAEMHRLLGKWLARIDAGSRSR